MIRRVLKKGIVWVSLLGIVGVFNVVSVSPVKGADLDELLRQKEQLDKQISDNQNKADEKAAEANTLEGQISGIEKDIANTENKIKDTNGQITTVQSQIVDVKNDIGKTEKELNVQMDNFNQTVVELYRAGRRTNLEKLLGSKDLADALEKTTYLDALQEQVNELVNKIKDVKSKLENQKTGLEEKNSSLMTLQDQQKASKYSAEAMQNQKTELLGDTKDAQANYDAMVGKLQQDKAQISAAIYEERARRVGSDGEQWGGGGSGYPFSCDIIDPWGFYTCQCTSYAAWNWNAVQGKPWHNTRPGSGSAYNWPALASDQGYSVSGTPQVGAIISWQAGPLTSGWGHVAIVEAVNGDGTIDLSEYNWRPLSFSRRNHVNPGDYGGYSYIY